MDNNNNFNAANNVNINESNNNVNATNDVSFNESNNLNSTENVVNMNNNDLNNNQKDNKNKNIIIIIIVLVLLVLLCVAVFVFGNKSSSKNLNNNKDTGNNYVNNDKKDDKNNSSTNKNEKCILTSTITKDHTPVSFNLDYKKGDVINVGGIDFTVNDVSSTGPVLVSAWNENMSSFIYDDMLETFVSNKKLDIKIDSSCKNWYFKSDVDNFQSNVDTNIENYTGFIFKTDRKSNLDEAPTVSLSSRSFRVSELYYTDDAVNIGNITVKRDNKGYLWFDGDSMFTNKNFHYATLELKKNSKGIIYANVSVKWVSGVDGYSVFVDNTVDAEGYSYINPDGYSPTEDGRIYFTSLN